MKVFVFTKRSIILTLSAAITAVILIFLSINIFFINAKKKKLPIYSVGGKDEEKLISLSFDAAWGNEETPNLLKTLDKFGVKATFFLVGIWVDSHPDSVKAIFDAGHDVENHSNTHPDMTKITKEKMIKEIDECNKKIEKITGKKPELFRAPYGAYNDTVIESTDELKMYCMQWNIDSLDWKKRAADVMLKKIEKKIRPGSIILMHNDGAHTPELLPNLIKTIQSKEYKIVPISQIIHKSNFKINYDGTQVPDNNDCTQTTDNNLN